MFNGSSSDKQGCYVIAAIDGNHNGHLDQAKRLIDTARVVGANAVKFQFGHVGLIHAKQGADRRKGENQSISKTGGSILGTLDLSTEQLMALREHARPDMDFIVAPYDLKALGLIPNVMISAIQVDSPVATQLSVIEALRDVQVPLVVCTDQCGMDEVLTIVKVLKDEDLTLVHSIHGSAFDEMLEDLRFLSWLRGLGRPIGYSNRGIEYQMAPIAFLLGAHLIEKTLTISREMDGPYHSSSLMPDEFSQLVKGLRKLEGGIKGGCGNPLETDPNKVRSPSLTAGRRIPKGSILTRGMLTIRSSMNGLNPRLMDHVLGKRAIYDIEKGDCITFGVIST